MDKDLFLIFSRPRPRFPHLIDEMNLQIGKISPPLFSPKIKLTGPLPCPGLAGKEFLPFPSIRAINWISNTLMV
jgi:hypothetical protein